MRSAGQQCVLIDGLSVAAVQERHIFLFPELQEGMYPVTEALHIKKNDYTLKGARGWSRKVPWKCHRDC